MASERSDGTRGGCCVREWKRKASLHLHEYPLSLASIHCLRGSSWPCVLFVMLRSCSHSHGLSGRDGGLLLLLHSTHEAAVGSIGCQGSEWLFGHSIREATEGGERQS